jgi:hypothetical protein
MGRNVELSSVRLDVERDLPRSLDPVWDVPCQLNLRPGSFGPLKQPPPLPIRLLPDVRLDLEPAVGTARTVGRIPALRHDALEPVLLHHAEQRLAVVEWLGAQDGRATEPAQKGLQTAPARFKRPLPQILAVERQEIERLDVELRKVR